MKVRDFKRVLANCPDDADVVLDSRDGRGGYLFAITSVFPPDVEEGVYSDLVMLRAQRVHSEDGGPETVCNAAESACQ